MRNAPIKTHKNIMSIVLKSGAGDDPEARPVEVNRRDSPGAPYPSALIGAPFDRLGNGQIEKIPYGIERAGKWWGTRAQVSRGTIGQGQMSQGRTSLTLPTGLRRSVSQLSDCCRLGQLSVDFGNTRIVASDGLENGQAVQVGIPFARLLQQFAFARNALPEVFDVSRHVRQNRGINALQVVFVHRHEMMERYAAAVLSYALDRHSTNRLPV